MDTDIKWDKMGGLIPAIAQDYRTGQVHMLAYMSPESLQKTLDTGLATYWSRSREKLWTKGEEDSGNFMLVREIYIDCDADAFLLKVEPLGPACHTGENSCFYTRMGTLGGGTP